MSDTAPQSGRRRRAQLKNLRRVPVKELEAFGKHVSAVVLLVVTCGVSFFAYLGDTDFWQPDEARYAEVAREMVEDGHWVVPHNNGVIYANKPPMYSWLAAATGIAAGRFDELTARLPSALAATGMVLLTYLLATKMYNWRTGVLSGMVLALSPGMIMLGRLAVLDALLGFFVLAAIVLFYWGFHGPRPALCFIYGCVAIALGVLTKGPVALILVLVPSGIFAVVNAVRQVIVRRREPKPELPPKKPVAKFFAAWAWAVIGLLLTALIVSAWVVPACFIGGSEYMQHLVFGEGTGKSFLKMNNERMFLYYVPVVIGLLLPWSLYLPGGFAHIFRKYEKEHHSSAWFLTLWIASILVLFTCFGLKRAPYILPVFPAAAIVVGRFWDRLMEQDQTSPRLSYMAWVSSICGVVFFACGLAGILMAPQVFDQYPEMFAVLVRPVVGFLSVVLLIAGVGAVLFRKNIFAVFAGSAVLCATITSAFFGMIWPDLDYFRSAKEFCPRVAEAVPTESPLAMYTDVGTKYVYYTHRFIREIRPPAEQRQLLEYLAADETVYCLIRDKDYEELQDDLEGRTEIVLREAIPIWHRNLLLIKNVPKGTWGRRRSGD